MLAYAIDEHLPGVVIRPEQVEWQVGSIGIASSHTADAALPDDAALAHPRLTTTNWLRLSLTHRRP